MAPGAPLAYRGLLVGLRKTKQLMKPSSTILEDYFINIAVFKETLDKLMKGGSPLYPAPVVG